MTIPHFFQSSEIACGPACLRMLMAGMGVPLEEREITLHCELTELGTTIHDLEQAARAFGFQTESLRIFHDSRATDVLSNSAPFVAMIDLASLYGMGPMFRWHFVVPLTLDKDHIRFHDPADGPDRRVGCEDFLVAWATAGYHGLRLWMR